MELFKSIRDSLTLVEQEERKVSQITISSMGMVDAVNDSAVNSHCGSVRPKLAVVPRARPVHVRPGPEQRTPPRQLFRESAARETEINSRPIPLMINSTAKSPKTNVWSLISSFVRNGDKRVWPAEKINLNRSQTQNAPSTVTRTTSTVGAVSSLDLRPPLKRSFKGFFQRPKPAKAYPNSLRTESQEEGNRLA
jgi:hypothetical protein